MRTSETLPAGDIQIIGEQHECPHKVVVEYLPVASLLQPAGEAKD